MTWLTKHITARGASEANARGTTDENPASYCPSRTIPGICHTPRRYAFLGLCCDCSQIQNIAISPVSRRSDLWRVFFSFLVYLFQKTNVCALFFARTNLLILKKSAVNVLSPRYLNLFFVFKRYFMKYLGLKRNSDDFLAIFALGADIFDEVGPK